MAKFTGSYNDFEKFIGPRLRNIVQTSISRNYKKRIGKCEECNTTKNLHSAHIHGKDRKTLIKKASEKYFSNGLLFELDLIQFEDEFRSLHYPLEENFKILCEYCHRKYDNVLEQIEFIEEQKAITAENNASQTLEILLYPNDTDEFKELLLLYKSAYIKTIFKNGISEVKEWKAEKFTESSNVIGNLRSRLEFRQGNWQDLGIERVEVEINY